MRLILMRHGKSSWAEEGRADRDRPLAPRGIIAADEMGAWLSGGGLSPDLILCSPARRTRETLLAVLPHLLPVLPSDATIQFMPTLYGGEDDYADLVARNGRGQTILVIGHNPAIQSAATQIVGHGPTELRDAMQRKFATAAVAVIDLDLASWRDLVPGCGRIVQFVTPD